MVTTHHNMCELLQTPGLACRSPPYLDSLKICSVGRFVKIHSLASDKGRKHNGKTAVVKTPLHAESGRCGVEPVDESGKSKTLSIKPSNLTIMCLCCKMRGQKIIPEPIICKSLSKGIKLLRELQEETLGGCEPRFKGA